ncbi:MAG: hypothetical protein IKN27_06775, partial [Selenomonadaceae bacterium]|nr:hypothetical protein [Selenomonadaceae bacterium]
VDGTTLSIMSGAGNSETYQIQDTTYELATATSNGLMSAADKAKLDGIDGNTDENAIEEIWIDDVKQNITNKKVSLKLGDYTKKNDLNDYAKKTDVASLWKRQGSVNSFADLPTNAEEGDVYNIKTAGGVDDFGVSIKAGDNVVRTFDGKWDVLAGTVDLSGYVEKVSGKQLSTNDFTDAQKAKLNNLASITSAGTNITISGGKISGTANTTYTAGSNITISGTTISGTANTTYSAATTTTSGLMSASDKAKLNNLASITSAGNNITISGGKISAADTTYSDATTSKSGLMSASDKAKLNGITANANNYTLPAATASTLGGVKIGSGISVSNGVISVPTVTSSANGLMSSTDKKKLDSLASITAAGNGITISGGTISAGSTYTLPTANATQKGGVIIGNGLSMDGDTLSANVMAGATSNTAGGASGLVPAPAAGDQTKFLRGDGTWSNEIVLPTVASSLAGSLWREVNNGVSVIKYTYGNTVYSLLSANTAAVAGVPAIGTALDDWTWEQISAVSLAGLGDVYFDIGDSKEITLNGNIGDYLTLENEKLRVFILHFNYAMNGTPDNNIIWGGFKTADGTDVALCDGKYGAYPLTDGTICFTMNHWGNVNYGGWKGADLRYDILGATSTQPNDYGKEHTTANVGYDATAATLTNPKADTLLAALPSDF